MGPGTRQHVKKRLFFNRINVQGAGVCKSMSNERSMYVLPRPASAGFSLIKNALMRTQFTFHGLAHRMPI
jgi:hypothetical protein